MRVNVTVNLTNGEEFNHEADIADFSDVRRILNDALNEKMIDPDQWSSLLVTIVNKAA